MKDLWYRCEVRHYSIADEWGDHEYTNTQVVWTTYEVARYTNKGVWLYTAFSGEQFVLGTAKKQLACPTKETALADAIARKKRHIAGCQARLSSAEADLSALLMETTKHG